MTKERLMSIPRP